MVSRARKSTSGPPKARPKTKPTRTKPVAKATAKTKAKRPVELKTRPTDASVTRYLARLPAARRAECQTLANLMGRISRESPRLWGTSIVGYGTMHYAYASGRTGEWMRVGFAPRTTALTIYLGTGLDAHSELLARLGRHRTGKGCLYVKRLADIDLAILARVVRAALARLPAR